MKFDSLVVTREFMRKLIYGLKELDGHQSTALASTMPLCGRIEIHDNGEIDRASLAAPGAAGRGAEKGEADFQFAST